jgi:hypothetical protein
LSFYFLLSGVYNYKFLILSENSYNFKNFEVIYKGRIYFFRNDVSSFSPTQLSSRFYYKYKISDFSFFVEHFCENTINYKPYDIKRYDILGINYKNFGFGWTFNKRYVDYEYWLIFNFYYFLFKGEIYFGISENFKKFYPFLSIWLLNISGFETFYNPNSADTLNLKEIPSENPLKLFLFGSSLGLISKSANFEINKFIPINDYIYNFNYNYEVEFTLKEKLTIYSYLNANSITQLIYPKWLILGSKILYKGFGFGISELWTTNVSDNDLFFRREEIFLNFNQKFKFLSFDFKYRLVKSDSLKMPYLKIFLELEKSIFFVNLNYEVFNGDFDSYLGFKFKNLKIYYLKRIRNLGSFDYFSENNDLFGVKIYLLNFGLNAL